MPQLHLLDDGVIYRNPDPGFKAECAFLPNVVPLDGDEVICVYRIGQAFYSTDGTLNVARSTDGWQDVVAGGPGLGRGERLTVRTATRLRTPSG